MLEWITNKMNLYTQFETHQSAEINGIWIEYEGGSKFLVARSGGANKKYINALAKARQPLRKQIMAGNLSEEKATEIIRRCFLKYCLLGWKNVADKADVVMEFSFENAMILMTSLPELFNELVAQADLMANYQNQEREDDKKN